MERVFGLSIGTSNICVAVYEDLSHYVLKNDAGSKTIPCAVSFTGQEILTGDSALGSCDNNEANTIPEVTRLIGKTYNDPLFQEEMKDFKFTVVEKPPGMPSVEVEYMHKKIIYRPTELLTYILKPIKERESNGRSRPKCVIAVPPDANDLYISEVMSAAQQAGFDVLGTENEVIATILGSEIINPKNIQPSNIFVFIMGSNSCTVSIVRTRGVEFNVIKTATEHSLGGRDFDEKIIEIMAEIFEKHFSSDIMKNSWPKRRLQIEAESAKKTLSTALRAPFTIYNSLNSNEIPESLTRDDFENRSKDLFDNCVDLSLGIIEDAELDPENISTIICVGGASSMPKISSDLCKIMKNATLHKVDPIEVIACGAAIKAEMIANPGLLALYNDPIETSDDVNYKGLESGDDEEEEEEEK